MAKDELFKRPQDTSNDFSFGPDVANVFDDMLARSVPFYDELQRMIVELAQDFVEADGCVYDLGCATGITLARLHTHLPSSVSFIGIDSSPAMLQRCEKRLASVQLERDVRLLTADLNEPVAIADASVVLMILTLQFIRPLRRARLIRDIANGLATQGCLILVEKVLGEHSTFNRLFIKHHYEFKGRNGYSELETSQKREALENVLIPYKLLENRELLLNEGFRHVDVFFKWYNFCGMIATK